MGDGTSIVQRHPNHIYKEESEGCNAIRTPVETSPCQLSSDRDR